MGAYAEWRNLAADAKARVPLAALGLAGLHTEMRALQQATAAAMREAGSAWLGEEVADGLLIYCPYPNSNPNPNPNPNLTLTLT